MRDADPVGVHRFERAFNIVMGAVLVACTAWAVFAMPDKGVLEGCLAFLAGLLGGQALLSGLRGRRSWLSRIGPLP